MELAQHFGLKHKNVLQDIKNLMGKTPESFNGLNFQPVTYLDEKGEQRPCFLLTRDAFTLLVMGWTSARAIEWKLRYIEAFNALERAALENARLEGVAQGARAISSVKPEVVERLRRVKRYRAMGLTWAEVSKLCKLNFSGTALWTRPTDVANLPDVTPEDIIPPRLERAGARLGIYDPEFRTFKLAMGGTVTPREDANAPEGIREYYLGGRKPTLSFDPAQDKLATFDPYALWEAGTTANLSLGAGQDAGNRWRLQAPAYQISKPGKGERGTLRTYQFDGTCTGQGDDEVRLAFF